VSEVIATKSEKAGKDLGARTEVATAAATAATTGTEPTDRRAATLDEIGQALAELEAGWDRRSQDFPGWMAQDLTFGQMRLLFLLSKHGPTPVGRVADWLGVGLPATSGIVDRVERHGLLMRQHRQDDRRVVECALTDQGRRFVDEVVGGRREVLRQMLGVLDEDELTDLARLVNLVLERVSARGK
jgi:DNA-binding MarR family transcriptional regulator